MITIITRSCCWKKYQFSIRCVLLFKDYGLVTDIIINLYKLFFEAGFYLLKSEGTLCYISPSNYITSADSINLRKLLMQKTNVMEIIEYEESDRVFDAVTQAVCTTLFSKKTVKGNKISYIKHEKKYLIAQDVIVKDKKYLIKPLNTIITKIQQPIEFCPVTVSNRQHHFLERIVFQGVANAGQKRRIKGTLAKNILCGHTTNYIFSIVSGVNNKFNGIKEREQTHFTALVGQILSAKQKNPDADTIALERQIDYLVYKLYSLTPAEIAIVEGKNVE